MKRFNEIFERIIDIYDGILEFLNFIATLATIGVLILLIWIFFSGCYFPKYVEDERYYLTERYFEHNNFMYQDSIIPAEYDRFGYYIWIKHPGDKKYHKIYLNDIAYMKIHF